MGHRQVQTRRRKTSDAPQMISSRRRRAPQPDVTAAGDWYIVLQSIERDGVAYLPLDHHLVKDGAVPERVPSCGAKGGAPGENSVPVNSTGLINLLGATDREVFQLCKCGAVRPVDPAKSHARIVNGQRAAKTVVPAMIPPMRRVDSLARQYEQATSVSLTPQGAQNLNFAQATMPSPFGR